MSQTKYKWMVFLVVILLVSNITLAFFLFFGEKKEVKRKSREELAMEFYKDLGLNQVQIDSFKASKDEYFKEMRPIWGEVREMKDSLYRNMGKLNENHSAEQLLIAINQKNLVADQKTFQHFTHLRGKLQSSQYVKFDTLIAKMINRPWNRNRK